MARIGRTAAQVESQIKLSAWIAPQPNDDELTFLRQLGLGHCYTWLPDELTNYEYLAALVERVRRAGLTLYNVGNLNLGKSARIHLGLPGRDDDIARFAQMLRDIGRAGIGTTTFTWEPDQVWSSAPSQSRFAKARHVNLDELESQSFTHDRAYSLEELWANFEYFMRAVIPVAEECGVRLSMHPNDPPTGTLGGIPCLINSRARYERAFAIADSPMLGMEFCTGCWLEGGEDFGDMLASIHDFAAQRRIFIAHFRNVSAPQPVFTETFLDNGYFDMYAAMQAFVASGYDGTMILDHTPEFAGDFHLGAGTAYAIAYMRALIERAEDELGAH
ncbi:MAG: mannonate dehydratase [Chloroflexota bacterium]|nr:mannonate dehydratase [Chloroflexota bacterium]